MTLFNSNFYPTPRSLAEKMLEGINWLYINNILEPSAGSGSLAEVITEKLKNAHKGTWRSDYKPDIDCIEIDPNLQAILKEKGFRLVHDDFLTYEPFKRYSIIISNPPFDNGEKHLLKMIDIQKDGGSIICLLNAETIKNPYSYSRKTLVKKLTELNATIEYLQEEFKQAERKTLVEVALVKIYIPETEKESIILTDLKRAEKLKEQNQEPTAIIEDDYIKQAVTLYNFEVSAGLKLIDEFNSIKPYLQDSFDDKSGHPILKLCFNEYNGDNATPNEYIKKVRYKYWKNLFTNPKFTKNFTSNLLSQCQKKVDELKNYDFSEWNILSIRAELTKDIIKGVEETIQDLFDLLTHEFHWHEETKRNKYLFDGWKTNSAYKIGKKSILPYDLYSYISKEGYSYSRQDVNKLIDIEKTLNYLDGETNQEISIIDAIEQASKDGQTKNLKTKYFDLTCYKKGTIHLTYTNIDLINKLNRAGANGKGWLPPGYGKKEYTDMDQEEKEVINSFEGEDEYKKVTADPERYLPQTANILMIGE